MGTRYIVIDYMHRVFKTMNCTPLSCITDYMGQAINVDTTIANYTIKAVLRFADKGGYPTVVCLEGGCPKRVEYFSKFSGTGKQGGYKDGRGRLSSSMRDGMNLAIGCMVDGGVSCAREVGYEADDYIFTIVQMLKANGVTDPIDVITGDRDMLPLVDNQVSVYINSPREWNADGCPKLRGYFQVTPKSWDLYISYASEYKGYDLPYNSVLLYKMIKGDKSDNILCGIKGYGGVKFSAMVQKLREANCPFETIFRYGLNFEKVIAPVLQPFFTEDELTIMHYIYEGINLMYVQPANGAPITMPKMIPVGKLQQVLLPFKINLNI